MKPIQVGLMGFGVVGSGVFNVLQRNQAEIQRRAGPSRLMTSDVNTLRISSISTLTSGDSRLSSRLKTCKTGSLTSKAPRKNRLSACF